MARTRDEAAFTAKKAEILRAAEALFIEKGFHQTGMAAICAAAGMSPGALYRYFPSKTDIIRAFVEEERSEAAALFERLEGARDFRRALAKALEETIAAVADETYGRLALEIAAEGARDPEIAAILAESEADAFARLTAAIKRAQKQGQVAESIDAKASARVLLMLVDGATGSAASPPVSKAKFRAALSRMLEGLF